MMVSCSRFTVESAFRNVPKYMSASLKFITYLNIPSRCSPARTVPGRSLSCIFSVQRLFFLQTSRDIENFVPTQQEDFFLGIKQRKREARN